MDSPNAHNFSHQFETSHSIIKGLINSLDDKSNNKTEFSVLKASINSLMGHCQENQTDLQSEMNEILESFRQGIISPDDLESLIKGEQERSSFILRMAGVIRTNLEKVFEFFSVTLQSAENGEHVPIESLNKMYQDMSNVIDNVNAITKVANTPSRKLSTTIHKAESEMRIQEILSDNNSVTSPSSTPLHFDKEAPNSTIPGGIAGPSAVLRPKVAPAKVDWSTKAQLGAGAKPAKNDPTEENAASRALARTDKDNAMSSASSLAGSLASDVEHVGQSRDDNDNDEDEAVDSVDVEAITSHSNVNSIGQAKHDGSLPKSKSMVAMPTHKGKALHKGHASVTGGSNTSSAGSAAAMNFPTKIIPKSDSGTQTDHTGAIVPASGPAGLARSASLQFQTNSSILGGNEGRVNEMPMTAGPSIKRVPSVYQPVVDEQDEEIDDTITSTSVTAAAHPVPKNSSDGTTGSGRRKSGDKGRAGVASSSTSSLPTQSGLPPSSAGAAAATAALAKRAAEQDQMLKEINGKAADVAKKYKELQAKEKELEDRRRVVDEEVARKVRAQVDAARRQMDSEMTRLKKSMETAKKNAPVIDDNSTVNTLNTKEEALVEMAMDLSRARTNSNDEGSGIIDNLVAQRFHEGTPPVLINEVPMGIAGEDNVSEYSDEALGMNDQAMELQGQTFSSMKEYYSENAGGSYDVASDNEMKMTSEQKKKRRRKKKKDIAEDPSLQEPAVPVIGEMSADLQLGSSTLRSLPGSPEQDHLTAISNLARESIDNSITEQQKPPPRTQKGKKSRSEQLFLIFPPEKKCEKGTGMDDFADYLGTMHVHIATPTNLSLVNRTRGLVASNNATVLDATVQNINVAITTPGGASQINNIRNKEPASTSSRMTDHMFSPLEFNMSAPPMTDEDCPSPTKTSLNSSAFNALLNPKQLAVFSESAGNILTTRTYRNIAVRDFRAVLAASENPLMTLYTEYMDLIPDIYKTRLLNAAAGKQSLKSAGLVTELFGSLLPGVERMDAVMGQGLVDIEACENLASNLIILHDSGDSNTAIYKQSLNQLVRSLGEIEAFKLWVDVQLTEYRTIFERVNTLGLSAIPSLVKDSAEFAAAYSRFISCQGRCVESKNRLIAVRDRCVRYKIATADCWPFDGRSKPANDIESDQQSRIGRYNTNDIAKLHLVIEGLENELEDVREDNEQLNSEIFRVMQDADRTPGALLFFATMHDPATISVIQQLILQLGQLKGFADGSIHIDFATLRKRIQVCVSGVTTIDRFVQKFLSMYKKWTNSRFSMFANRSLTGGDADSGHVCPLCNTDARTSSQNASNHGSMLNKVVPIPQDVQSQRTEKRVAEQKKKALLKQKISELDREYSEQRHLHDQNIGKITAGIQASSMSRQPSSSPQYVTSTTTHQISNLQLLGSKSATMFPSISIPGTVVMSNSSTAPMTPSNGLK